MRMYIPYQTRPFSNSLLFPFHRKRPNTRKSEDAEMMDELKTGEE